MPELSPDPWFLARAAVFCLLVVAPFAAYELLVRRRLDWLRGKPLLLDPMAYLFVATAGMVLTKTGAIALLGTGIYEMPFLHESILGSQTTRILSGGYLANIAFLYPVLLILVLSARGSGLGVAGAATPPGRLRRLADRALRAPALPAVLALALGAATAILLYFLLFDLEIGSLRELSAKRFLGDNRQADPGRFYSLRYVLFKLAGLPKIICVVALASYLFAGRRRSLRNLALLAVAAFFLYGIVFSVRAHIMLFTLEVSLLLALARPRRWRAAAAALLAAGLLVCMMMTVVRMRPTAPFWATALHRPSAPTVEQLPEPTAEETITEAQPLPTGKPAPPTTTTPPPQAGEPKPRERRARTATLAATSTYRVVLRLSTQPFFSDISKLSMIIDRWRPEQPWLYGQTLYSWVTLPLGNTPLLTFAELGRLLGKEVFHHPRKGVTPGLIGELYVNFSWPGIVVGGFFLGALAWRFRLWTGRGIASPLAAALLSLAMVKFFLLLLNSTLGSTVLTLALEYSFLALLVFPALFAARRVPPGRPDGGGAEPVAGG